jgi:hypothetical protein
VTDPERWLHSGDAPSGMSEMLSLAQKAGPTAAQKAALATKLGVGGSGAWLVPLWKGLALGGAVLGVAWGVSTMGSGDENDGSGAKQRSQAPVDAKEPPSDPSRVDEQVVPQTTSEDDGADRAADNRIDDSPVPTKPSSNEGHAAQPRMKSVPTEALLIKNARAALEKSPDKALAFLSQHAAHYPAGVLAEEREVLRIRALKNVGRLNEAATEEQQFRKSHPDSVHHLP